MPNYVRPRVPGACVFLTVRAAEAGTHILVRDIDRLRAAVRAVKRADPFAVDAWVVLPDHMHCVWTLPDGDSGYARRVAAIKARFSRGLPAGLQRTSHLARREKGIWQRRFWERHVRDEDERAALVRYCWLNPVKHGLVERPTDWPHSSIHRDIRAGIVDPQWTEKTP